MPPPQGLTRLKSVIRSKKSGLLQQPHTELAYAPRLAARRRRAHWQAAFHRRERPWRYALGDQHAGL